MSLQCGLEGEATVVMSEIFRGLESRHVLMLPWPLHHITQSMAGYCKRCACPSTLSKGASGHTGWLIFGSCHLQEGSKGGMRKEFGSLDDAGHAVPTASGASSDSEPSSSRGSAAPQSLAAGPEGRSSSIGEVSCTASLHALHPQHCNAALNECSGASLARILLQCHVS